MFTSNDHFRATHYVNQKQKYQILINNNYKEHSMGFTTKRTLLEQVRDGDPISWEEFYKMYVPLIKYCAKEVNLQEDLDDVVQDIMLQFFNKRQEFIYDPTKGRFSHYLREMVHHHVFRVLKKQRDAEMNARELKKLEKQFDESWEDRYRATLIKEVVQVLKTKFDARAFQAFHLSIFQGVKPLDIAERLEISVSAVYTIRSRGIAYLKEMMKLADLEMGE